MGSTTEVVSDLQLPHRIQTYLDAVIQTCTQAGHSLVSVLLFGSATKGGFSSVSDVDLIIVVRDDAMRESTHQLREIIARLETVHGFRPAMARHSAAQARVERAVGHLFSCFVCTRSDLLSGDVARVIGLKPWEAPFVDRIILAGFVASAVTVWGEDLVPLVRLPPIRRLDVFKAMFSLSSQVVLSAMTFLVLPDSTKYAMGALKHSLHSCFFCYQQRTASLDEEVAFFNQRLGTSRTLVELMSLREHYRRSFAFVIRCLPTIARLHLRTARDNRFPLMVGAAPRDASNIRMIIK